MEAAAGKVVDQIAERLRRAAAADDLDRIGRDDGAARLAGDADTRAVIGTVRVVLPQAGVGVELVVRGGHIDRRVRGVRRVHRKNLENRVREIDEFLELLVALRCRRAVELDGVGVSDHQRHRPACWNRNAIELYARRRVSILRDQVLDVELARGGGRHRAGAVRRRDVVAARGVEGRGHLRKLDLEVRIGARARRDGRDSDRGQ